MGEIATANLLMAGCPLYEQTVTANASLKTGIQLKL